MTPGSSDGTIHSPAIRTSVEHAPIKFGEFAMRWATGIAIVYAVLCLVAFLLIPAADQGWLGVSKDPLSGVFVIILALPWTLLLPHFGDIGIAGAVAVILAGMAFNIAILLVIGRLLSRRAR